MLPPRPPSVFGLGIGLGAGLKPRNVIAPPKSFVDLEILSTANNNLENKTIADIMRSQDAYRLHLPVESECELLNTTRDRLCCENLKELMTLCGARAGVRFESDLLERLTRYVEADVLLHLC